MNPTEPVVAARCLYSKSSEKAEVGRTDEPYKGT